MEKIEISFDQLLEILEDVIAVVVDYDWLSYPIISLEKDSLSLYNDARSLRYDFERGVIHSRVSQNGHVLLTDIDGYEYDLLLLTKKHVVV